MLKIFTKNNSMFSLWFYREKIEVNTDGLTINVLVPPTLSKDSCGLCGNPRTDDLETPQMCPEKNETLFGNSYMINHQVLGHEDAGRCLYKDKLVLRRQNCLQDAINQTPFLHALRNINLNANSTNKRHLVEKKGEQICISKSAIRKCQSKFF